MRGITPLGNLPVSTLSGICPRHMRERGGASDMGVCDVVMEELLPSGRRGARSRLRRFVLACSLFAPLPSGQRRLARRPAEDP
jgi:hypothetical protein